MLCKSLKVLSKVEWSEFQNQPENELTLEIRLRPDKHILFEPVASEFAVPFPALFWDFDRKVKAPKSADPTDEWFANF